MLVGSYPAKAQPFNLDGNALHTECQLCGTKEGSTFFLAGLSLCLVTAMRGMNGVAGRPLCFPEGVQVGQGIDIICNYLQANPATRHNDGADLAAVAMFSAFQCRQ